MPNSRSPEKTERITIWCDKDTKEKWDYWQLKHADYQAALKALLKMKEDNPELVRLYDGEEL